MVKAIWIVMGSHGDYSDKIDWPVRAHFTKRAADKHVQRCEDEQAAIRAHDTFGDGRDLWEVRSDLEPGADVRFKNGRDNDKVFYRQWRKNLKKVGIDIPSDERIRPDHIGGASWFVVTTFLETKDDSDSDSE